jgi:AcrR family transcriptional regulator
MPRGFSEREKEGIRDNLLDKGRVFLTTYGVKKTNVEDLTRAVGISKGAFYLFYASKEELFFEVLGRFEDEYHAELLKVAVQPGVSSQSQVQDFLKRAFSVWRTNPLFTHFSQEEYEHLVRKLPEEKVRANLHKDRIFVGRLLDQWRDHGVVVGCSPEMFLGLMRALFFISLHEQELGPDMSPAVIDFFIDLIAQRVVQK